MSYGYELHSMNIKVTFNACSEKYHFLEILQRFVQCVSTYPGKYRRTEKKTLNEPAQLFPC